MKFQVFQEQCFQVLFLLRNFKIFLQSRILQLNLILQKVSIVIYRENPFRNWTNSEDLRLLAGMLKYGSESWTSISKFVGNNRTRSQCSQRWNRGLNPRISKEPWTPDEDRFLISLVHRFGEKSWTRVSASIASRSDVQCRYRYYQITRPPPKSPVEFVDFPSFSQQGNIKKKKIALIPRVPILPPPVFPPQVFPQPLLPPTVLPPSIPSIPSLTCSQYNPLLYSVF